MRFTEPILHVDMDAFFVEVERLRRPELRGRPVAVGGGGNRGVVASASYEARRFGVTSAMPTVRARRLCPQLVMVPADHAEYRRCSEAVFAIFRETTPLVEGLSMDEAFLDCSGLRLHVASPVEVAEGLRARIRAELDLPASVGIASTKFIAKLASQRAKPDGVLHVPADRQLDFLHPLPVRALWGVGEATHAALTRLGIETVGDLLGVDARSLASAVGPSLAEHLSRLARGVDPRPVEPDSEAKSVSAEHTYERDLTTDEEIAAALRGHADRVASRARRAGVRGRTVTIKVRFADFTTVTRSETLPEPTDTGIEIYRVALRLLERVQRGGRGVRLLGVGLAALAGNQAPRQLSTSDDDRWSRVEAAIDTARARFGAEAVRPAAVSEEGGAVSEGHDH